MELIHTSALAKRARNFVLLSYLLLKDTKKLFFYLKIKYLVILYKMEVEGLERKKQDNPYNYTEDQLAEKKLALHNMKIIYPDVNEFYAEMVYDMCKNTDEAKIELLKQKILNEPFKYKERYKTLQEELDLIVNDTILNPIVVTQPLEKVEPNTECDKHTSVNTDSTDDEPPILSQD